jgi:hypothetical protein
MRAARDARGSTGSATLEPPTGFAAFASRPRRYAQPPGTPPGAYLPPLVDWVKLFKDHTQPLILTEGELKAIAATQAGFPTIGLGGVWSFRSAKAGFTFLPELEKVRWCKRGDTPEPRPVFIVFDTDIVQKPEVREALLALAGELTERGALVREALLPSAKASQKVGLDDFLVAGGDLTRVLEEATPLGASAALWELSREVAYVHDPGVITELLPGGRTMRPIDFIKSAYANRIYTAKTTTPGGKPKLEKRNTAKDWIAWPARFEVRRFVYEPGAPRITEQGELNEWTGWGVTEPKRGNVEPWRELLSYLFAKDREKIRWFEQWCAYPIQAPGTKLLNAIVLWGLEQGTGKSLIGLTLGRIYGKDNFAEVSYVDLTDRFNDWLAKKQLVLGDEIAGEDRRAASEIVKRLITQQEVRINPKGIPAYLVRDHANFIFTSNHPDPIYIDPGDRRFFVHEVRGRPLERAFYEAYDAWYRSAEGIQALLHHLLHVRLDGFLPNAPALATSDKEEMIRSVAGDLDAWCRDLLADPTRVLVDAGMPETLAATSDLFTAEQLRSLYDPRDQHRRVTRVSVARALRRAGALLASSRASSDAVIGTVLGTRRIWAVRRSVEWAEARPAETARAWVAGSTAPGGVPDLSRRSVGLEERRER